jgi:hypothetical protein
MFIALFWIIGLCLPYLAIGTNTTMTPILDNTHMRLKKMKKRKNWKIKNILKIAFKIVLSIIRCLWNHTSLAFALYPLFMIALYRFDIIQFKLGEYLFYLTMFMYFFLHYRHDMLDNKILMMAKKDTLSADLQMKLVKEYNDTRMKLLQTELDKIKKHGK